MAEQRQPFRFRLPWLTAPQPAPAAPRPTQTAPTPQPAATQRQPFRPAGVAPAQSLARADPQPRPPSRAISQTPARSRGQTPSRAPPARAASQTQFTSPARRVSPQNQPAREPARPKSSAAPPPTSPEAALKAQPGAKPMKQERLQPPTQEPKQSDAQESKPKASTELAIGVSGPKPKVYQTPFEEHLGMIHDEPKEKKVDSQVSHLKTEPKKHPLALLDERSQYPSEEVFDRKEVLETFRTSGHHTETDINDDEKVGIFAHKTAEAGEKPTMHKEIKAGSRFAHKLGGGKDKHPLHEKPFSIITLTGENTGATMHLGSESATREQSIHIHQGYKIKPDESVEPTTDGEGSFAGKKSGDSKTQQELARKLYVNNNAQGINNSLVFDSSVTERNPGVNVVLSRNAAEPIKPGKGTGKVQTRKAEVTSTPAERLTYAPTIRRRCLRGLLLESIDSDPENPEKPRRHGCRVGCEKRSTDEKIEA